MNWKIGLPTQLNKKKGKQLLTSIDDMKKESNGPVI